MGKQTTPKSIVLNTPNKADMGENNMKQLHVSSISPVTFVKFPIRLRLKTNVLKTKIVYISNNRSEMSLFDTVTDAFRGLNDTLDNCEVSIHNIANSFHGGCMTSGTFVVRKQYLERAERLFEKYIENRVMGEIVYDLIEVWRGEGGEESKLGGQVCDHIALYTTGVNTLVVEVNRLNNIRALQTEDMDHVVVDLTPSIHDMYVFVKFTVF